MNTLDIDINKPVVFVKNSNICNHCNFVETFEKIFFAYAKSISMYYNSFYDKISKSL